MKRVEGPPVWVTYGIKHDVDDDAMTVTTGVEILAVSPSLYQAEDMMYDHGPLTSGFAALGIAEAPMVDY